LDKNMRKAILLVFFILAASLFPGCSADNERGVFQKSSQTYSNAPIERPGNGQLVFRLADNWGEGYSSVLGDREFARLVEERSDGKLKIVVYPDAVLGDEKSVIEQVQLGGIDFARVNSAPLVSASDKLSVLSLPYLFRDSEHLWNVLLGPIGDELLSSLKAGGITGLAYFDSGARSFYTKVPIYHISDLKNLRIRIQQNPTFESFIKLLGATPVPVVFGEVYNALQQNEIDGAENNWPSYYSTNHYKIAKYYILDEHTRNPEILIASNKTMDKLKEEYRRIIISSAKDSVKVQRSEWAKAEKISEEAIRKSGVVILQLDEEERQSIEKTVAPLYEEYSREYKDLIERIKNTT
jgi:tripartite ATP-independent transporter DctP family solute receptor